MTTRMTRWQLPTFDHAVGLTWPSQGLHRPIPTLPGLAGILMVIGVLVGTTGSRGLAAGTVLVLAWFLLPAIYVVALGHILLLLAYPTGIPLPVLAGIETGFLLVLLAPARTADHARVTIAAGLLAFLGLTALAAAILLTTNTLWLPAIAVVGATGLLAYGIHRYQLVRLGLVETQP